MKKNKLVLPILLILFIGTILCGCTEPNENNDSAYTLEITNVDVFTEAYSYQTGWKSYGSDFQPDELPDIADHPPPYLQDEFSKARYNISILVTNTGSSKLTTIHATASFYHANGSLLFTRQFNKLSSLEPNEQYEFKWNYAFNDENYQAYFPFIDRMTVVSGMKSIEFNPDPPN